MHEFLLIFKFFLLIYFYYFTICDQMRQTPFSTSETEPWKTIMELSPTVNCVFYSILAYTSGVPRASVVGFPTVFTGVACLPIPQHRMQIPTQATGLGGQGFLHHLCSLQKVMRPCALLYLNSRCGKPTKGKITGQVPLPVMIWGAISCSQVFPCMAVFLPLITPVIEEAGVWGRCLWDCFLPYSGSLIV